MFHKCSSLDLQNRLAKRTQLLRSLHNFLFVSTQICDAVQIKPNISLNVPPGSGWVVIFAAGCSGGVEPVAIDARNDNRLNSCSNGVKVFLESSIYKLNVISKGNYNVGIIQGEKEWQNILYLSKIFR